MEQGDVRDHVSRDVHVMSLRDFHHDQVARLMMVFLLGEDLAVADHANVFHEEDAGCGAVPIHREQIVSPVVSLSNHLEQVR